MTIMENTNLNNQQSGTPENDSVKLNNDTDFENPSVDPGFAESGDDSAGNEMEGREDERSGNIDSGKSIKEMREEFDQDQDAMNNKPGDGAYDPTKI
jgi:hypothetical protein